MKRSRSVRVHVARLVVAAALPLLVFGGVLLVHSADSEQRIIATTVRERAEGAAADLDRELRNLQDLVSILANSHDRFTNGVAVSDHYFQDSALGLVVRHLSGELLFDTCTGEGRPLPLNQTLVDALSSDKAAKPQISELVVEPISGEPFLTIDARGWRDGDSVLLFSLCALPRILRVLLEQHLPSGWGAVVVDGQGHLIASVRESASGGVGAAGSDQAVANSDLMISQAGSSGPGYEASSPVHLAGWTVAVNIPGEIFSAPIRHALLILIVAGGGTLVFALALASVIGRRIAGSLTHLSVMAKSLGSRGHPALPHTGISESDLIGEALCTAAEDLSRRTLELTQMVEAWRDSENRLRELSEDLRQALDERGKLLNRIVSAQESERQRIARELHDHLGQYFTAMLLGLDAADRTSSWRDEVRDKIADLKGMTLAVNRDVHQLSWELRPTALDDLGLEAAIANYLEKWSGRFDLYVDFVGNLRGRRLSAPVEITLYRVLQEAMTNIARHAHAQRISVVLEAGAGEVRLIVEDDGVGFTQTKAEKPAAPAEGFGLLGIRERLALVGGSLSIEPASGHGTVLFSRVPA